MTKFVEAFYNLWKEVYTCKLTCENNFQQEYERKVDCISSTLQYIVSPVKKTTTTLSYLFCVTKPKLSTDFIFVLYSFYNFLQNKTCFYHLNVGRNQ